MNLPPKRIEILQSLFRYPVQRAGQLRDELLPSDKTGANTRAHLRPLVAANLVRKYQPRITDPLNNGSAPPVYTLTCEGGSVLAAITGDVKYLIKAEVSMSSWMNVNHWCSLSEMGKKFISAFAGTDYLLSMHYEHEVVDLQASDPSKRYLLYTKISDKIVFVPDMLLKICVKGHKRALFVEYETGSSAPQRSAASKHKGVAGIAGGLFKKAFPEATDFRVVAFCPNAGWRDALRKEFKSKPGAEHWLFCATPDVKKETFLHEPILYTVEKGPFPLIPRPTEPHLGR